jgi:hypothetical protein
MQWELIVALVVAIPVILFPVAYVWFINIGGLVAAIKHAREKQVIMEKNIPEHEMEYNAALIEALKRYPWNK